MSSKKKIKKKKKKGKKGVGMNDTYEGNYPEEERKDDTYQSIQQQVEVISGKNSKQVSRKQSLDVGQV